MLPMDFDGFMATSQVSIHDQTNAIARCFFFMRDVAKSERSISDRMNVT